LVDAGQDEIEARARGEIVDDSDVETRRLALAASQG